MKNKYFILIFMLLLLSANTVFAGRCSGSSNCSACSTCSSCGYCNSGGSCGVCGDGSSGGGIFGRIIFVGGGIIFLVWLFSDNSNNRK